MWRKTKYVFIALMLVVVAYGVMSFTWSIIAERKAETGAELLATLRPGYTTMDSAKNLFQAHGVDVDLLHNACGTPDKADSCDGLYLYAANFPRTVIPLHVGGSRLDIVVMLKPLPPVKTAGFVSNLYFINGILNSIGVGYDVGTTSVRYARGAGEHTSIWSEWKYEKGGTVESIRVSTSGAASDVPFPRFAFNYMYSVRCVDARMLWPTAPPPTTELHGWKSCR